MAVWLRCSWLQRHSLLRPLYNTAHAADLAFAQCTTSAYTPAIHTAFNVATITITITITDTPFTFPAA
jgi:hypothetical protein